MALTGLNDLPNALIRLCTEGGFIFKGFGVAWDSRFSGNGMLRTLIVLQCCAFIGIEALLTHSIYYCIGIYPTLALSFNL